MLRAEGLGRGSGSSTGRGTVSTVMAILLGAAVSGELFGTVMSFV